MKNFRIGQKVKTIIDWPEVPKGSVGTIVKLYESYDSRYDGISSIMISWDEIGTEFPTGFKHLVDGFSPDEFKYLVSID